MAKFATENDARTFEHQMSVARKNKAIKIKTFRCDPKIDPAFPIPHWQTVLDKLKQDAKSRVDTLLNQHNENEEAVAKIKTCPFRNKRYPTAGTSSPFALIQINDIK